MVTCLCVCLTTSAFALKQTFQTMAVTERNAELETQLQAIAENSSLLEEIEELKEEIAMLKFKVNRIENNTQFGNDTDINEGLEQKIEELENRIADLEDHIRVLEEGLDTDLQDAGWHFEKWDPEHPGSDRLLELGICGDYAEVMIRNCGAWDTWITGIYFGTSKEDAVEKETNWAFPKRIYGYDTVQFLFNYNWTEGETYYFEIRTEIPEYGIAWNGTATPDRCGGL